MMGDKNKKPKKKKAEDNINKNRSDQKKSNKAPNKFQKEQSHKKK